MSSVRVSDALVAVGFSVLGLVSIIFSLLFLVVQWAFDSLSPRLNLFRDDPIVWRTFGFAIGVFVYSVSTALVIGDQTKVSVIVPATEVVAVLAALALIRSLQVKAFASIQLAPTLAAIAGQGRGILDDLYRRPCPADCRPAAACRGQRRDRAAGCHRRHASAGRPGRRPARRRGGRRGSARRALVTGQERTFHQDPLFAFRLLADIGLRALSAAAAPAVRPARIRVNP